MTDEQKAHQKALRDAYTQGMNDRRRGMTPEDVVLAAKAAFPITQPRTVLLSSGAAEVLLDGSLAIQVDGALTAEDQQKIADLIANPLEVLDE